MKVLVNETSLTGIADAIRGKNGTQTTYKPSEMAAAIASLSGGGGDIPEEAFLVKDNCLYALAGAQWKNFFENEPFKSKWRSENISNAEYMFFYSTTKNIPFTLNFKANLSDLSIYGMFENCYSLEALPELGTTLKPYTMRRMFYGCNRVREIPESWAENFDGSLLHDQSNIYLGDFCYDCNSLRNFPSKMLKQIYSSSSGSTSSSRALYYNLFNGCYVLDEVRDIPVYGTITSNAFSYAFYWCKRLKDITFETNEDGSPKVAKWKGQTIDLSDNIGYTSNGVTYITGYNSGITSNDCADSYVSPTSFYNFINNNPNWYTTKDSYSRYNRRSAIETINSLPDTSAYLAANGGTNTIKFRTNQGSATRFDPAGEDSVANSGNISKLTAEEIAVATAKGWTVSFV